MNFWPPDDGMGRGIGRGRAVRPKPKQDQVTKPGLGPLEKVTPTKLPGTYVPKHGVTTESGSEPTPGEAKQLITCSIEDKSPIVKCLNNSEPVKKVTVENNNIEPAKKVSAEAETKASDEEVIDIDEQKLQEHRLPASPFGQNRKSGSSSIASIASSSASENKTKRVKDDLDQYEDYGNWLSDARLRRKMVKKSLSIPLFGKGSALASGFEEAALLNQEIAASSLFPKLNMLPYKPLNNRAGSRFAYEILKDMGEEFNIKPNYVFEVLEDSEDPDGPLSYKVTVTAGVRDGVGFGGTRRESMNEAAENCLRSLKESFPDLDMDLNFKKWTKMDPEKDILYVLSRTCKDYGLPPPEYNSEVGGLGQIVFTCQVGEIAFGTGTFKTKRVSKRLAALNAYEQVRKVYDEETS